ncbi:hypothetical protein GGR57DRAFT_481287 [Xylariaceae sp. FL1272]|nr:hypothetical protein GGR57DRAFT_481287 [Xylariaceae sp. FL1272]
MAATHPFQGKVIAVTGASRGSGLALTRYLLARGAKVSMAATSKDNLEKAVEEIEKDIPEVKGNDRVLTTPIDVSNPEEVKFWIEATVEKWGKLDGAANVAAQMNPKIWPIETLPLSDLQQMLNVNVIGTFNCMQQELRHMNNGGSIVNCGSQQVKYASGNMGAYAASKNAIKGLTQCAAFEAGAKGIRVNLVCPGCID